MCLSPTPCCSYGDCYITFFFIWCVKAVCGILLCTWLHKLNYNEPFTVMLWNVRDLNSQIKCSIWNFLNVSRFQLIDLWFGKSSGVHRFQNRSCCLLFFSGLVKRSCYYTGQPTRLSRCCWYSAVCCSAFLCFPLSAFFSLCVWFTTPQNKTCSLCQLCLWSLHLGSHKPKCNIGVSIDSSGKADAERLAYCIKINNSNICFVIRLVHDPKFSTMLSYIFLDLSDCQLMVGRDFNQVCDINLDKSTSVTLTESQKCSCSINKCISDVHIIVPQCLCNPLTRNYTLFSPGIHT